MKKLFNLALNVCILVSMLIPAGVAEGMASRASTMWLDSVESGSGLFRTTVTIEQPYDLTRLEKMGVKILAQGDSEVSLLTTESQLETLARLGFEPQASMDLGFLVSANAESVPWLANSMKGYLDQSTSIARQSLENREADAESNEKLVDIIQTLSIEQSSALQALPGVDNDADGLTDTQEAWWCTDPDNPDSDGDGVTDGTEVIYIKDWVSNHGSGIPSAGKPFAGWPYDHVGCYDDDYDSVPDLAERWELGLNMNRESTDGDKFDDGQELFGITSYPGYGALPRPEDTFITSSMPGWVDPPGNSPVVAAYPIIDIDIIPSSVELELVTNIMVGETHGSGEVFGYSTSNSSGISTSIGKEETHTVSEWQEIGNSQADTYEYSHFQSNMTQDSTLYVTEHTIGTTNDVEHGRSVDVTYGTEASIGAEITASAEVSAEIGAPGGASVGAKMGVSETASAEAKNSVDRTEGESWTDRSKEVNQTITTASRGTTVSSSSGSSYTVGRIHETSQVTGAGYESSQATSIYREDYEEFAVSNDHQIATSSEWSTATAVDSSHAANMTFSFKVNNIGTDNAREISDTLFNIFIEDEENPISTYAGLLTGESCTTLTVNNLYPGVSFPAEGVATQCPIALSLGQLAKIDSGARVKVIVANYKYGDDEQFYNNAWGEGVIVEIDDDTWDGDENIDSYLIPTWGVETYQDVVRRYFKGKETAYGNILSIFSPEYNSNHEIVEWNEYLVTDRSWWNIYLSDKVVGEENYRFKDKQAIPESRILLRFNSDTDLDYFSDRIERDYTTDLVNPNSHPNALLVAGFTQTRVGNEVYLELAMENRGDFDAVGVEATMFAMNDSITIDIPIVGIAGKIPFGQKVLLSSRILDPEIVNWSSDTSFTIDGHFSGNIDTTFTFSVNKNGQVGVTDGLVINWSDTNGRTASIPVGTGYLPPTKIEVVDGIFLSINSGILVQGDSFTVRALTPKDVLKYTINDEPYTPPEIVVSYNDPAGNKRFSNLVELQSITDDLSEYIDEMGDPVELTLDGTTSFDPSTENQVVLVFVNPRDVPIENGKIYIQYGQSLTGDVVATHEINSTFLPGPNLFVDTWNVSEFVPAYNPDLAYKVKAIAMDNEGTGIDVAISQFIKLGNTQPPQLSLNTESWDFGILPKGQVIDYELAIANTGFKTLWVWSGTGEPVVLRNNSTVNRLKPGEMEIVSLTLDTSLLPLGEYNGSLTLRTNDPGHPTVEVSIIGTIVSPTDTVTASANPYQPLEENVYVKGPLSANTISTYTNANGINTAAEPIVFTDNTGTVVGTGEKFLDLVAGPIPLSGIGDHNNESKQYLIDNLAAENLDLTNAVELEEYRTDDSRVYVWPDGHGVAISANLKTNDNPLPNEAYGGNVRYDGFVNSYYPGTSTFNNSAMYIGNYTSLYRTDCRSLIAFNLPGLPSYSVIDSAYFYLYSYSWPSARTISTQVYRITSDWSELSYPTWNTQPSYDFGSLWSSNSFYTSSAYQQWNITGLTQSWYNGTYPNYGLMVRNSPENANGVAFYTKEGTNVPYLTVNFHMTPPPGAPTLYAISNSDGDGIYSVDWSDVSNTTSYDLEENYNSGSWSLVLNTASTIYNASGKSMGTWCYRVKANNAYGSSSWSTIQCTTVNPPPNTPIITAIDNVDGNGDYLVDWDDVPIANSYELQENINAGPFATIYSGSTSGFTVVSRGSGQWCYRVKAINPSGSSIWSSIQCSIVNTPPNVPVELLPLGGTSQLSRSVTFSWQDGGDPDNYPGTSRQYHVEVVSLSDGGSQTSEWTTSTHWSTVLPEDGRYSWRVESSDNLTTSGWSNSQFISVYSIERINSSQVNIALPINVEKAIDYRVFYGLPAEFITANTPEIVYVELPKRLYSSITLDVLVNESLSGNATFTLDVMADSAVEWSQNFNGSEAVFYESPNLATVVNNFMAQSPLPGGELVSIPVSVNFSSIGTLYITNVKAITGTDSDPMLGLGDLIINNIDPMETDVVNITARVRNVGIFTAKNVMVNYFVGNPIDGGKYIGSKLISHIPADGFVDADLAWNTSGYVGDQDIFAALDYGSQVAELNEQNNITSLSVNIRNRPDLAVTSITLSDDEPVVGEAVTITVTETNHGESDALPSLVSVFNGSPQNDGMLLGESSVEIMRESTANLDFSWVPDRMGWHRIHVLSDSDNQISEYDESNNQHWIDVYVGVAGPLLLDSGTAADPVYSLASGYGYIDINQPDVISSCGINNLPEDTLRRDPDGRVVYRFDHLQPGHFYHLDVILYECDGAGRQETILVDDNLLSAVEDLGDGQVHRLSMRLDPALYADRTITVAINAVGIDGAVVGSVNLYDIDYRYADAGGAKDPQYPGTQNYGWLDGSAIVSWGTLPYRSVRINQSDSTVRYQFDDLDPAKRYNVHFSFWEPEGNGRMQKVQIDGVDTSLTVNTGDFLLHQEKTAVPVSAYSQDNQIIVSVVRTNATTGAMINEIALEEETILANSGCLVQETPYFSETYGTALISDENVPVGTVIQAVSPRGDTVGCFTVTNVGNYGFMRIYGEDSSAVPAIPGMRSGEMVRYLVNGVPAVASPLFYWSDDHIAHLVNLNAGYVTGQSILLQAGWNLVSINVEPPAPIISTVLQSISGRYDRVLGEYGVYVPTLPDPFNTLREFHAATGYYLRVTGSTSVTLLVDGISQPCSTPKSLHAGWNWIGAPCAVTATATALESIAGHYQRVLSLNKTYDPALPAYSNLTELRPGEGYLIYITDPVTLTYPTVPLQPVEMEEPATSVCEGIAPTPLATLVYGQIQWAASPAPAGSRVEFLTPRGEVAGCGIVMEDGILPFTHVYGADSGEAAGFAEGELIYVRMNGMDLAEPLDFTWQDDKAPHGIDVAVDVDGLKIYLPAIMK